MPILCHFLPLASIGGCEINCLRIIEALPDFEHRVLVFGEPGPMDERWRSAGARVEHLSAWKLGAWAFQARLRQWAKTQDIPIGIYYWSSSRLPFILKALEHWGVPWGIHLGNPLRLNLASRLRLLFWRFCGASTSKVTLVACSNYVARSYRKADFFARFNIVTIYNPVAKNFDAPRVHRALQSGDGPCLGMVARLDAIKDQATIIRALPLLLREWPRLVIEFAGEGQQYGTLVRLAKDLGVDNSIRFLGSVNNVVSLLTTWDVYLHSTTPNEGMGIAVAEAMMAGMPCVLSDIEIMREVGGTNDVVYADPGAPEAWAKSIGVLLADQSRRAVLGQSVQVRARNLFSSDVVTHAYINILTQDD